MLKFVLRKMLNKKWMVLSLLIGNILLVSIACSNPMYTKAVLQRMLATSLSNYVTEKNAYPGLVTLKANVSTVKPEQILSLREMAEGMPSAYGVNAIHQIRHYTLNRAKAVPELTRDDDKEGKMLALGFLSDLDQHAKVIAGRMYAKEPDAEGILDVMVTERALIDANLLLDEIISFPDLIGPDGNPVRVRIAGMFTNSESDDPYWVRAPRSYQTILMMDESLFQKYFVGGQKLSLNCLWYTLLDYTAMRGDQAEEMLAVSNGYTEYCGGINTLSYSDSFSKILTTFIQQAKKVNITLLVLQVPIFVLLAAFIFMVARQMLEMEQNEIAVIKSRGAGRAQIISLYFIQSLILTLIALGLGIPLSMYLCQVLGSANAFLEFVSRKALDVEIDRTVLLYAAGAALFSVCAMVLPVLKFSRVTIVSHKQKRQRRSDKPMWQKLYLDIILLGVSLYGLYAFNGQKEILAQKVADGASLDPLLFFSSSLFMIGAGLFALRLLPVVVYIIFHAFKKFWSPALYASFLRVLRTRSSQGFIMVFLVMTIALGIFNAQAARTINSNEEDNIRYTIGADITLQEVWENNADQVAENSNIELVYQEPDFGRYEHLEGAKSVTKVLVSDDISISAQGGTLKNIHLLGINTKEFGETAWFKNDLLPFHWYNYLNLISQDTRAVLVSRNFETNYGAKLGDSVYYKNNAGDSARGIVYGFVDYWPSFVPVKYTKGSDGLYSESEQYLIVAHLSQLQSSWGITPYQIWIKAKDSTQFIYDFAQENGIRFSSFNDASAAMITLKNDPIFQGTNGILTVGFIVVLLLCAVGFLIYWILSIQSRTLQFGIFRAMGLSMREIVSMLLNEQLFISGLSIATGVLVGYLSAKLYIPLIQIAYSASDQALPLSVVNAQSDSIRLLIVVGIMILICMFILGALISRMKIAQALKLGED